MSAAKRALLAFAARRCDAAVESQAIQMAWSLRPPYQIRDMAEP
jgi:hypothetical protein